MGANKTEYPLYATYAYNRYCDLPLKMASYMNLSLQRIDVTNYMPKQKESSGKFIKSRESFEEERERMHHQMLSCVSHDLKTPLAAVIGSLEIYDRMKDRLTPEKQGHLISTALQEAYRLDNFVTNILDMAKLENGMVKFRKENCDLEMLLKDCSEKSGHHFKGGAVHIIPLTAPITIQTDPALMCRIIGVLLDNALKYGGNPPKATIHAWTENRAAIITVSDNGKGIPSDKIDAIFSKYTRLEHQDRQNAGTGLGLAIGREITALLGGTLNAVNSAHDGALFTLRLPLH